MTYLAARILSRLDELEAMEQTPGPWLVPLHLSWHNLAPGVVAGLREIVGRAVERMERHALAFGTERCKYCWQGGKRQDREPESWHPCPDAVAAQADLETVARMVEVES